MLGAEEGHVSQPKNNKVIVGNSKNVSSEGGETHDESDEDPKEMMDEEPEEDPEEEIYEKSDEEIDDVMNEEEAEEDPEEEEIDIESEEDPEEEIVEDPEEDPEEEINEESDEEDCGNELNKDTEEKSGTEVVEASGLIKVIANGECTSKQQKDGGSSGRKRQSRWDIIKEGETPQINGSKRQKTRWDNNDTQKHSFNSPGITNVLDLLKDPKILSLKEHLVETNKKLLSTCSARKREKLINKSKLIISKLSKSNLQQPTRFAQKILVPVKEYPTYNFIGLILGPKGITQKKMQRETGAKILLRGKGSGESSPSKDEELHVLVEAHSQRSLNAAVAMVEKLLIPVSDENNDHKRAQLVELAKQRGTYKDQNTCEFCREQGHRKYACPLQDSTFKAVCCDVCGSFAHSTSNCSVPRTLQESSGAVVDQTNLYVGYLSHDIDEQRLKELFLPFGKIVKTTVPRDQSTGLSKGYGFVKFENSLDAAAAVTYMNGYKMNSKMLAVRVAGKKPVPGPLHQPNIVGPVYVPAVPMLPEAAPFSIAMNGSLGFHSSSSYCGTDSRIARTEALNIPHPYVVSSMTETRAADNFSSGYDFCDRIPSSLSNSESVMFPGHPDYMGSQFNTYFTNPVINETPIPETDKKYASFSFASRFPG